MKRLGVVIQTPLVNFCELFASKMFCGLLGFAYLCSVQVVGHASQRDIRHRSHAGKRDLLL